MRTVIPKTNIRPLPLVAVAALLLSIIISLSIGILQQQKAHADAFTKAYVRLDHLTGATTTGGRVCATPSAAQLAQTENKVIVNFPTTAATDYVVNSTASNWTVNTTFESGFAGTAWPGIGTASSVSGKSVTFPSGNLTSSSTLYCFNFSATSTLTTSSAGAAPSVFAYIETQTAASAQIDKSFWGVTIISGETVTVSAIVAPFFTMALSGTTDTFATNLSAAAGAPGVNTSNGNRTIQVDTNALNGWMLWVKGTNYKTVTDSGTSPTNRHGALTSVTAGGYAIANNTSNALATPSASHAFSGGSEDYGLAVTSGSGSSTINAAYDGTTSNYAGVIDPTQYRPIASASAAATATTVNIKILATISNSTPPGADYTDTLYYVGAGQF